MKDKLEKIWVFCCCYVCGDVKRGDRLLWKIGVSLTCLPASLPQYFQGTFFPTLCCKGFLKFENNQKSCFPFVPIVTFTYFHIFFYFHLFHVPVATYIHYTGWSLVTLVNPGTVAALKLLMRTFGEMFKTLWILSKLSWKGQPSSSPVKSCPLSIVLVSALNSKFLLVFVIACICIWDCMCLYSWLWLWVGCLP